MSTPWPEHLDPDVQDELARLEQALAPPEFAGVLRVVTALVGASDGDARYRQLVALTCSLLPADPAAAYRVDPVLTATVGYVLERAAAQWHVGREVA